VRMTLYLYEGCPQPDPTTKVGRPLADIHLK